MSSRRQCLRPFAVRTVLIACPPLIALLGVLMLRAFQYYMHERPVTAVSAARFAWVDFLDALHVSGPIGLWILAFLYLASFGAVSAVSLATTRRWNPARVLCCWFISIAVILAFALTSETARLQSEKVVFWLDSNKPVHLGMPRAPKPINDYREFQFCYPIYAIPIALAAGWIGSLLPICRPSPRYWLARGLCPKCQYNLQGRSADGCPECGWNRRPSQASK